MRCFISMTVCLLLVIPAQGETPILERDKKELGIALATPVAVIPTAVNTPGRFGAYFKTRVVIHNMTSNDYSIDVALLGPQGPVSQRTLFMRPNQYRWWDNFLEAMFNDSGAGAVVFLSDENIDFNDSDAFERSRFKFSLTADVYTDSPNGRYSTTVVNGIVPLIDAGNLAFNAGISVNANQRTNLGAFNLSENPSSIQARVFDSFGRIVGVIRFEMNPFSWQQKPISVSVDNGFIRWEISGGLVYLWAVTVDNRSNDGTLIYPIRPNLTQ